MTHVPYRGVTEGLMSDMIAGRLDLMFNTTGSLLQPVRAKQLRGLAVTSAKRFPDEPELPHCREIGGARLRRVVLVWPIRTCQDAAGDR